MAQGDCPPSISGNRPCWSWRVIVLPLLRTQPPNPAALALLPNLALPLAPLPPREQTLAHLLLTLSRQEVRRRKALSSEPSLLPRNSLCFKNKLCSDCAASRAEAGPGLGKLPNPRSSLPSSALWAGNHGLALTPATSPTHRSPLSRVQRGRSSSLPFS